MCYHVATPDEARLKAFLSGNYTVEAYNGLFHASGYAHPNLPATTQAAPQNVQQLRWGLIPAWVKQEDQAKEIALKTLNARSETAHQLPSYKDSLVTVAYLHLTLPTNKKTYIPSVRQAIIQNN